VATCATIDAKPSVTPFRGINTRQSTLSLQQLRGIDGASPKTERWRADHEIRKFNPGGDGPTGRIGACGEVNRITGLNNAQALSPLSDETIAHFDIRSPWLCFTTNGPTAEIASSRFGQEMAY